MPWFWRNSAKRSARGKRVNTRALRRLLVEQFESRELLTTLTLTPVADNSIFSNVTSNSDGIGPTFFSGESGVGPRRALLKFDVAGSVPAGARIDSVTLQVHVFRDRGGSNTFDLHLVQTNWGE